MSSSAASPHCVTGKAPEEAEGKSHEGAEIIAGGDALRTQSLKIPPRPRRGEIIVPPRRFRRVVGSDKEAQVGLSCVRTRRDRVSGLEQPHGEFAVVERPLNLVVAPGLARLFVR